MRFLCCIPLCLTLAVLGFAQPSPQTIWQQTFDTGEQDYSSAIQATSDSGLVVAGRIEYSGGGYEGYVVRLAGNGDTLWMRRLLPAEGDRLGLNDVRETAEGGFILAGYTLTPSNSMQAVLICLNPDGDILWSRTYGGPGHDEAAGIRVLEDGFVFAGTTSTPDNGMDFWVVRANANGDTLWTRTAGGTGDQIVWDMELATDNGFVVCGYTGPPMSNAVDALLMKFDVEGYLLWSRVYGDGADSTDLATSVVQTPEDGGYLMSCITNSRGAGRYDIWVIKTTRSGDSLWTRTFGTSSYEEVMDMKRVADGYALFGTWINTSQTNANMYLMRVDLQGNLRWTQQYGGFNIELGTSLCVLEDGGYGLAGHRTGLNEQNWNLYVIRTGPDRTLSLNDRPAPVADEPQLSVCPNPFNPTAILNFTLAHETIVSLRVFDLSGREVMTLASERTLWAGEHHFVFDAAGLPSGSYFARLDSPGVTSVQKLLLIR